jgi:hypothetical protein
MALSGVSGLNINIPANEDSSTLHIFTILLSTELLKLIEK